MKYSVLSEYMYLKAVIEKEFSNANILLFL